MRKFWTWGLLLGVLTLALAVRYDPVITGSYYEADGYYWKMMSEQSAPVKVGAVANKLRLTPYGVHEAFNLHSVLTSGMGYRAAHFYGAFLVVVLALILYMLGGFLLLALVIFTPIVVARTAIGWNDTDIYVLIFLSLSLGATTKQRYLLAGLWICALSFFWPGWVYIGWLCAAGVLLFGEGKGRLKFLIGIGLCCWLWPNHFLGGLNAITASGWPSGLLTTAEMKMPALNKVLWLMSPCILLLGCLSGLVHLYTKRGLYLFLSLSSVLMILLGERFLLPAVPILAFSVCASLSVLPKVRRIQPIITSLILVVMICNSFNYRHLHKYMKVVDPGWKTACQFIEENTEENAVIISWWSAGHLITGLSNRAVLIDGGTQHKKRIFWIARALVTPYLWESKLILNYIAHYGDNEVNTLIDRRVSYAGILLYMDSRMAQLKKFRPVYLLLYKEMALNYRSIKKMAEWFKDDYTMHEVNNQDETIYARLLRGELDIDTPYQYTYNDGRNMIKVWRI